MTPRERVLTALRRSGTPDRMPFEISWGAFTPSLMERYHKETGSDLPPEEYFDFDVRAISFGPTRKQTDWRKYYQEPLPDNVSFNEFGQGSVPGGVEHFVGVACSPLADVETVEEVDAFPWPDLDADYRFEGLAEKVQAYHDRGYAVAGDMYSTLFETAFSLCGLEPLMINFYEEPEIVHAIIDHLSAMRINQARKFAEAGVDIIRLGDDVATQKGPMISPSIYREFLQPGMQKIISAGKAVNPEVLFFRHSCGCVEELIPLFIEDGIDILNPIQPECNDLRKIADLYGDKLSFWGGIGTQSVMPFGTPDEVRQKVQEAQQILGRNGGYLVAPSHILEPEVPWENVLAFVESAKAAAY